MTSYQGFTCDIDKEFNRGNSANKAAREDLDPSKLQIRLQGYLLSETGTGTCACGKSSRDPDFGSPDQNYFCINPHRWGEVTGSGAQLSPSLHTELGPISARAFTLSSCVERRHHEAFLDSSDTNHAGSAHLHEAMPTEKPFEWMKVKRNQAGTGKLESFCETLSERRNFTYGKK